MMIHFRFSLASWIGLVALQVSNTTATQVALVNNTLVNSTAPTPTITEAPSATPNWAAACDCSTTSSNCYYQYKICNDVMTFVSKYVGSVRTRKRNHVTDRRKTQLLPTLRHGHHFYMSARSHDD